ncbi:hypothetical protein KFU94_51860 [Chloroflexi bacterium TSY]|nr:hypothetical protein [Chloroflexi bacterium TSY]
MIETKTLEAVYKAVAFTSDNEPDNGIQLVDAVTFTQQHYPQVETSQLLLISLSVNLLTIQLTKIKQNLLYAYPPDHKVVLVFSKATTNQQVKTVSLDKLDTLDAFDTLFLRNESVILFVHATRGGF